MCKHGIERAAKNSTEHIYIFYFRQKFAESLDFILSISKFHPDPHLPRYGYDTTPTPDADTQRRRRTRGSSGR